MSYQDRHPYATDMYYMKEIVEQYREQYPSVRITTDNIGDIIKILIRLSNGRVHFSTNDHSYKYILMVDLLHYLIQEEYKRSYLSTKEVVELHSVVEREIEKHDLEDKMILFCVLWPACF
jgi:hypothetical protein